MDGFSVGDIIQITSVQHAWFPCLLIVSEVKVWGVVAYISMPQSNDNSIPVSRAYNRLDYGTFEKVGVAAWCYALGDES